MITVVDYGMGNIRSVVKAVELYTKDVQVSSDPQSLLKSKGVIMPGDGAFAMAMENLKKMGWIEPLRDYIAQKGFFFGICLGYQLLFDSSEEFGASEGLSIVPGKVIRFPDNELKVPHMGWNTVHFHQDSDFLAGVEDYSHFYFIHSFYPEIFDESYIMGTACYGESFPCIVGKGNFIATQFHPEKSHKRGLKIIENFVKKVERN
jgi:glutamine amidotransferase